MYKYILNATLAWHAGPYSMPVRPNDTTLYYCGGNGLKPRNYMSASCPNWVW